MPLENLSPQAFKVTDSTLECLEWSRLVDRLRACCRTPIGTAFLAEYSSTDLFELRESDVRARQAETSEVRDLLDADAPSNIPLDLDGDIARWGADRASRGA